MNAVIYCRVSSKEQTQNLSLQTQQEACLDHSRRLGLDAVEVFIEEGESAKTINRTEFTRMLDYCKANRGKVSAVLVYSVNRFARNQFDHYAIRAKLHGWGIKLLSVTEPIDDSKEGRLMEGVLASLSQYDNDAKAERTVVGMKTAAKSGRWIWVAPIGYLNDKSAPGGMVHDPERAPLVRKGFELYASGRFTKEAVRRKLDANGLRSRGGRRIGPEVFSALLKNPLYGGWIDVEAWGERIPGSFPPIVPPELYCKVQALLEGRAITPTPHERENPDFPLRHFTRCAACSTPLTASWSKGRSARYAYYRCRNGQCLAVNQRKEQVEARFVGYLESLQNPAYAKLQKVVLLDAWKARQKDAGREAKLAADRLADLRGKAQRLHHAFIYDQAIDRDVYRGNCAGSTARSRRRTP